MFSSFNFNTDNRHNYCPVLLVRETPTRRDVWNASNWPWTWLEIKVTISTAKNCANLSGIKLCFSGGFVLVTIKIFAPRLTFNLTWVYITPKLIFGPFVTFILFIRKQILWQNFTGLMIKFSFWNVPYCFWLLASIRFSEGLQNTAVSYKVQQFLPLYKHLLPS